jgi:hypothetical protein
MGNSSATDHELVRRIRVNSLKIFFLHLRIISKNFFFRDSRRQPRQYFFHRNAMSADAALPRSFIGFDRNSRMGGCCRDSHHFYL